MKMVVLVVFVILEYKFHFAPFKQSTSSSELDNGIEQRIQVYTGSRIHIEENQGYTH